MKQYKIIVTGLVQGVNFRRYTQQEASRLGLTGVVMNHPDGSVHIHAEGKEDELQALVEWCKRGSPFSKVTSVLFSEEDPTGYSGFSIRHFDL